MYISENVIQFFEFSIRSIRSSSILIRQYDRTTISQYFKLRFNARIYVPYLAVIIVK